MYLPHTPQYALQCSNSCCCRCCCCRCCCRCFLPRADAVQHRRHVLPRQPRRDALRVQLAVRHVGGGTRPAASVGPGRVPQGASRDLTCATLRGNFCNPTLQTPGVHPLPHQEVPSPSSPVPCLPVSRYGYIQPPWDPAKFVKLWLRHVPSPARVVHGVYRPPFCSPVAPRARRLDL